MNGEFFSLHPSAFILDVTMTISISCTNCEKGLEIDSAFAGGVCRCQHCGTIQTVPAHLKPAGNARPSGRGGAATEMPAPHGPPAPRLTARVFVIALAVIALLIAGWLAILWG